MRVPIGYIEKKKRYDVIKSKFSNLEKRRALEYLQRLCDPSSKQFGPKL